MKYKINFYEKQDGIWNYKVHVYEDFEKFIDKLWRIELSPYHRLEHKMKTWRDFWIGTFFAIICITWFVSTIIE